MKGSPMKPYPTIAPRSLLRSVPDIELSLRRRSL
jgi:hypothetical protein